MLSPMWLWSLLGYDVVAGPIAHGVCTDAASAMRIGEARVTDDDVFLCIVEEVRELITVDGLETAYQGTGRYFIGRRTRAGGVYWEAKTRTIDPSEVYRITEMPLWHDGTHATSDLH
jgi:hypothetical protein